MLEYLRFSHPLDGIDIAYALCHKYSLNACRDTRDSGWGNTHNSSFCSAPDSHAGNGNASIHLLKKPLATAKKYCHCNVTGIMCSYTLFELYTIQCKNV